MPTVENLTPTILWTTIYGLLALGLLFLIGYKVYDALRTIIVRHRQRREAHEPDFAEKVSQKVIDKLEPRFEKIEENLANDKTRLENHERSLATINMGHKEIHDGLSAICKFMLIISTYGNIGDNEKVKEASAELQRFLAEKL